MHFISRGAEAILYRRNSYLVKKRIRKGYRIKELDEKLRKERTKREVKLLIEARRVGVNTPSVIEKDLENAKIVMEYIEGKTLRDVLDKARKDKLKRICKQLGQTIAKLHNAGIIHGDLTTSNIILKDDKLWIIDFGLGMFSNSVEDKAVDLHLLKCALISKHSKRWKTIFKEIIKNYNAKDKEKILKRLEEIEKRGRYAER